MSKSEKLPNKSGNEKKNVDKNPQRKVKKDKSAKELVDKHMSDEDHIISEEDLKNVTIDTTTEGETAHKPLDIPADDDRPKDEDKDHRFKTPWDVLDQG